MTEKSFSFNDSSTWSLGFTFLMLALVMALWAGGIVIARGVHESVPPVGFGFWRWTVVTACLVVTIWPRLAAEWPVVMRNWKLFLTYGFYLVFGSTMMLVAVNFTTAINANLVNASQPAVTIAVAWLLVRDRTTRLQLLGVGVALAGIVYMVVRGDLSVLTGFRFYSGDFWMLIAVIGYASYAVRLRRMPKGISPLTALCVISGAGALLILPFYVVEMVIYKPVPLSWQASGAIVFMGVLVSLLPVMLWNESIRRVGVNRAAIFVNLMPVFGAIFAIAFLGERLFLFHVVGAVMVFAGIVLVVRGDPAAVKRTEQPAE